jgi:hypothetical protein
MEAGHLARPCDELRQETGITRDCEASYQVLNSSSSASIEQPRSRSPFGVIWLRRRELFAISPDHAASVLNELEELIGSMWKSEQRAGRQTDRQHRSPFIVPEEPNRS